MSTQKGIGLLLSESDREFSFTTGSTGTASSIVVRYSNKSGEKIDLVTGLINLVVEEEDKLDPDALKGWTTIDLHELQIRYDRFLDNTKQFGFSGRISWHPDINFWSDDKTPLNITASLDLAKLSGQRITGEIRGRIQAPIEGLEFLSLGACLRMYRKIENGVEIKDAKGITIVEKKLFFQVQIGKVIFEAAYDKPNKNELELEFGIKVDKNNKLTLGDVITFFASLVDPSIDEYEFDPPWDFISRFDLGSLLNSIRLKFNSNKATKEKSFTFILQTPPGLIPAELNLLKFTSLEIKFTTKPKRKTSIFFYGDFLGFDKNKPLNWDLVDGKPLQVPGKEGALFKLRYLGLGQHIAFTQAAHVNSIGEVMGALRGTLKQNHDLVKANRGLSMGSPQKSFLGDKSPIAFSAESEWLIGLDVSLLHMLNLSLIFNDPLIYGLRIELYGAAAKNFKGFVFEILYTKISDTIGKYHGELVLPDLFRRMEFGAVTIILPGIIVDVYTNGDFGVDLGFPRNFDYTRSFGIEIFPFTGAGGFYFRKLSAATSTNIPKVKNEQIGVFTTVYEFGLGLRVGLGKSFNKGPLRAEISITLQAVIEGVISWYRPVGGDEILYYKLRGGLQIVGRLYGAVDFVIISIEIEVVAKATILFVVEVYKDIQILLSAEVSVSATVKILMIEVKKKFEMRVEQEFIIDSPTGTKHPENWLIN
ncbi:MAG: hypothetical protein IPM36_15850 [Lewinellaceae bacterium]|nr:hypothetical protein [Lewinellaceae bacterium]